MNVLIDTCVWSLALRRDKSPSKQQEKICNELRELITEHRAVVVGPIVQELLSGIKEEKQFEKIKKQIILFNTINVIDDDHIYAAELYNHCRKKGIQGAHIDFLLCAISIRNNAPVFTVDKDFVHYSKYTPLMLHVAR